METKCNKLPDDTVTKLSSKVYDDVAHSGLKEVGNIIGSIISFVALPFTFLGMTTNELKQKYQSFISNAINKVPKNNLIIPSSEKIGLLLDQAKFSFNHEEMCTMFEDLLASFCDENLKNTVHPYYLHILSQLSPNDAHILKFLTSNREIPCIDIYCRSSSGDIVSKIVDDYYIPVSNTDEYLRNKQSIKLLKELGIISRDKSQEISFFFNCNNYEKLLDSTYVIQEKNRIKKSLTKEFKNKVKFELEVKKYSLRFTEIGRQFIECCIRDAVLNSPLTKQERSSIQNFYKNLNAKK